MRVRIVSDGPTNGGEDSGGPTDGGEDGEGPTDGGEDSEGVHEGAGEGPDPDPGLLARVPVLHVDHHRLLEPA